MPEKGQEHPSGWFGTLSAMDSKSDMHQPNPVADTTTDGVNSPSLTSLASKQQTVG
jgi:hypothetical protein